MSNCGGTESTSRAPGAYYTLQYRKGDCTTSVALHHARPWRNDLPTIAVPNHMVLPNWGNRRHLMFVKPRVSPLNFVPSPIVVNAFGQDFNKIARMADRSVVLEAKSRICSVNSW